MPLSRDWTVADIWVEAVRDTGVTDSVLSFEKVFLVNRVVESILGHFPFMWQAYISRATGTLTNDVKDASLRELRVNHAAIGKVEIESTATKYVEPLSTNALRTWRPNAQENRKKLVWGHSGDRLFFQWGSELTPPIPVMIRYPRLPEQATGETDKVDLPDGPAITIAILQIKKILSERYQRGIDISQDIATQVKALYDSFGMTAELEEIATKIKTLS